LVKEEKTGQLKTRQAAKDCPERATVLRMEIHKSPLVYGVRNPPATARKFSEQKVEP